MTTKRCPRCDTYRVLEEDFFVSSNTKSGYYGHCKECSRAAKRDNARKIKARDPEAWLAKQREYGKRYKEKHPERTKYKEWRQSLKTKFGITPEQYGEMLVGQGSVCAICGLSPEGQLRRFAVDHDRSCCPGNRSCGKCIRGILCTNCNTALGLFMDGALNLRRAIAYLGEVA